MGKTFRKGHEYPADFGFTIKAGFKGFDFVLGLHGGWLFAFDRG